MELRLAFKRLTISFLCFFVALTPLVNAQDRLHLLPPGTELVDKDTQGKEGLGIETYKYYSDSTPRQIVDFYRTMFSGEGFQEFSTYPRAESKSETASFFWRKKGRMVMLHFLRFSEEGRGTTTYFITVHKMDMRLWRQGQPAPKKKKKWWIF